ncbi:MAG: hypothetical protein ABWW65_04905 [Thermoprotei archaeon]
MVRQRDRGVAKAVKCVEECMSDVSKLQYCFVDCYLGVDVVEAYVWIRELRRIASNVSKLYGLAAILYSREFRSFIEDPRQHLGKKLFIYTHDFIRGRIKLEEYAEKAMMAINTSLRTNMRTLYQDWCILALLKNLYRDGTWIVFPEHRVLSLERSGKQKLRWIPPNLVIDVPGSGSLSFFIEAPRPIAWEDSSDLAKTWKFYTALRPDVLVYGGRVYDIVDLDNTPPVKKPDVILEFKELPDWYKRVRDVKGPLAKPLSAEEWRSRWIEGLWDGLADVLGVSRREAMERVEEKRGIRLTEVKVVKLYRSVYNPKEMILVSKHEIPEDVKNELEAHDIVVYDDIGFNPERIKPVANKLLEYAVPAEEYVIRTSDRELAELLEEIKELWEKGLISRDILRKILLYSSRESSEEAV